MSDDDSTTPDAGLLTWTNLEVLDPDHPILDRFQENLHQLLAEEKEVLTLRIRELEEEEKEGRIAREKLGSVLYDLQRSVESSGNLLNQSKRQLASAADQRQAKLQILQKESDKLEETRNRVNKEIQREKETQKEMEISVASVSRLQKQLSETKSELARTKGLLDHGHRQRDSRHANKILQDLQINQIMAEIESTEMAIHHAEEATLLEEEVASSMRDTIRQAHLETSALNAESLRVHQAWQKSIQLVQRRDGQVEATLRLIREEEIQLEIMNKATESAIRELSQLEEQKTSLQFHLGRTERNANQSIDRIKSFDGKDQVLKEHVIRTQAAIKANEESLHSLNKELEAALKSHDVYLGKYRRIQQANKATETAILDVARDHVLEDQGASTLYRRLRETDTILEKQELLLAQMENALSRAILEEAQLETAMATQMEISKNKENQATLWQEKLYKKESQLERERSSLSQKEKQLLGVAKKLENLQCVSQAETEEQRQIISLKEQIKQTKSQVSKLQCDWTDSQQQLLNIASVMDQIALEEHKYLQEIEVLGNKKKRLQQQILQLERSDQKIRRSVENLHENLQQLDAQMSVKKNSRENGQRLAQLWQAEWKLILEEPERALVQLQNELDAMKEQKSQQEMNLCNYAKLLAMWQAKFHEIRDTRDYVMAETSDASGAAAYRAEIHRLEVERVQLRREQEHLNHQLEKCLLGRSLLNVKADLQETVQRKKSSGRSRDLKSASWHKVLTRQIAELTEELSCVEDYEKSLRSHFENLQRQKSDLEQFLEKTRESIAQHRTDVKANEKIKLQYICRLVELQQGLKFLEIVKTGKYRRKFQDRDAMIEAENQIYDQLHRIHQVIASLENQFPDAAALLHSLKETNGLH